MLGDFGASNSWVEAVDDGRNIEVGCAVSGGIVVGSTMLDTGFCTIPSVCGIKSTEMGGA